MFHEYIIFSWIVNTRMEERLEGGSEGREARQACGYSVVKETEPKC